MSQAIDPAWKRYIPVVDAMIGGRGESEQKMRCEILLLRDKATQVRARVGWEAADILDCVNRIGHAYGFRSMPLDDLEVVRASLMMLTNVAGRLEHFGPGRAK